MAEDQKETFGEKVDNYADQYEAALKENAAAFKKIAIECVEKGIKTAEDVAKDAKNAGIAIKTQTLAEIKKAENFAKQKYSDAKGKVTETKDKVVAKAGQVRDDVVEKAEQVRDDVVETAGKIKNGVKEAAGQVRDGVVEKAEQVRDDVVETVGKVKNGVKEAAGQVVEGAAMTAGAVVATGRLGKKAAIKGAKTVQAAGTKVYTAAKGTAEKGLQAVGKWFKDRGRDVKNAKDKVVTKAGQVRDGVVETAGQVRDGVVETAGKVRDGVKETAGQVRDGVKETAGKVRDGVKETAGQVRDGVKEAAGQVVNGAAMTAGVVVLTGRLGKQAAIKGAKTVQAAGSKAYTAAKGTTEKGLKAVGKWFKDRGRDVKDAKDKVVTKAGQVRDGVVTKAGQIRDGVVETAGKVRDGVVTKAGQVRDGVKDVAETAAIYGLEAKDKVVDAAETVAIYGLEAKDKVVDVAETAAIYGLEAKDKVVKTAGKVKDGVVEGAAMTAGVVVLTGRLGKQVAIKGAKTVQAAGSKAYTAAKGTTEKGLKAVGKWFKDRGRDVKDAKDKVVTKAGQIRDGVVETAGQIRDGVVTKAGQVRDGVVETAGKVKDGIVDGAAKVVAVPVAAKNMTKDAIENASSRVQTRANTSIINFAKGGRTFMEGLFDRLETSAVSREERNQEAVKQREEAKNKSESSKEQDDSVK